MKMPAAGAMLCSSMLVFFILSTSPLTADGAAKCNKSDKQALLAVSIALNGNKPFPAWTDEIPCCEWSGVDCDPNLGNGRVTGLHIFADASISGSIPSAVADLPFLSVLVFHKLPNLVGSVPPSIIRLTRLSLLELSWNSLSGPVPSFLSRISSLTFLGLAFNQFSGEIPPELSLLQNLGALHLDRNQLTGPIPASFGSFRKSSPPDLYLSHNNLSGEIPLELGTPEWGIIDLSRNWLTGDATVLFGSAKPTTQIDLSRNRFAFDLSRVSFPVNLTLLDLSHNMISGSIPVQINRVSSLVGFNVSYNRLCGEIPSGPVTGRYGQDVYFHNKCLCGSPLPACRKK
ncbi:Polygalacturonase inhibitor [Apostasia shenzhenica]|uniref:Polygalacturonase inhibitor n=1 Tax=Apostasia shenzhenica TaxID=1088818 RepID=A0A2H9ZVH7_9ASPA|nr:Polygalacturonase inhibitor [Apostasia shenzhenica]